MPLLKSATKESILVQGLISLHISGGDLHAHAYFSFDKDFAVDVLLGTAFSDRSMHGVFVSEQKIESVNYCLVTVRTSPWKVIPLLSEDSGERVYEKCWGNERKSPVQ